LRKSRKEKERLQKNPLPRSPKKRKAGETVPKKYKP